jgi:ubiquitin-conjugating enzyme E2 I
VCLSILNEDGGWKPSLTVSQVLNGVQELLGDPNLASPAQSEAYMSLQSRPAEYARLVAQQARRYPPPS